MCMTCWYTFWRNNLFWLFVFTASVLRILQNGYTAFTPRAPAGVLKPFQHSMQIAFLLLSTSRVICCHSVYPWGHVPIHFHPRFCVTQHKCFFIFSLLPTFNSSYVCSYINIHLSTSSTSSAFLLGSGFPNKHLSCLISGICCTTAYACLYYTNDM